MFIYFALTIIIISIANSIRLLFSSQQISEKKASLLNFLYFAAIYATVMIGFGLIYIILEMQGYPVLDDGENRIEADFISRLQTSLYFSAVTLFSVGYGEIAPIGIGRFIAVSEALIGYTIPAAFVARTVLDIEK